MKLFPNHTLKPDISRSQRVRESVLLKERWALIQNDISRKHISSFEGALGVNSCNVSASARYKPGYVLDHTKADYHGMCSYLLDVNISILSSEF